MGDKIKVTHIVAEFIGCEKSLLERAEVVKEIMEESVKISNLTKVRSHFHQFNPHGVTGFILLKESHASIHTWPEHNYAAIDVFGCGDKSKILKAYSILVKKFKPSEIRKKEVRRGL